MTGPTRAVLDVFLTAADTDHYGLSIGSATRLPSGTIHPILARLEGLDWLASRWEDVDPAAAGRPRRRLYRLTEAGRAEASAAVALADARRARLARLPSPATVQP